MNGRGVIKEGQELKRKRVVKEEHSTLGQWHVLTLTMWPEELGKCSRQRSVGKKSGYRIVDVGQKQQGSSGHMKNYYLYYPLNNENLQKSFVSFRFCFN